jgi:hypothetical protein
MFENVREYSRMFQNLMMRLAASRCRERKDLLEMVQGLFPESQGQKPAVAVFYVPYSLDSIVGLGCSSILLENFQECYERGRQ